MNSIQQIYGRWCVVDDGGEILVSSADIEGAANVLRQANLNRIKMPNLGSVRVYKHHIAVYNYDSAAQIEDNEMPLYAIGNKYDAERFWRYVDPIVPVLSIDLPTERLYRSWLTVEIEGRGVYFSVDKDSCGDQYTVYPLGQSFDSFNDAVAFLHKFTDGFEIRG